MGVDRHCPGTRSIRRESKCTIGEREHRSAVRDPEEVLVFGADDHRHLDRIIAAELDAEVRGVGVVREHLCGVEHHGANVAAQSDTSGNLSPMTRIASVLVVVLMLSACSDTDSSAPSTDDSTPPTTSADTFDSYTTVEVPELGFSIDQPLGWTAQLDVEDSILQVTAPAPTDGFTPNFNVAVGDIPQELPAIAYFEGEVSRLEATLPGVEILEVANLTIDGAMARGITLTSTENDTTIGISRLIILDENNRAWELTFFAEASTLERLSRVVQTIFASFRFLE